MISIAELTQEVPEAWMEEIDVNGKTIRIDAPIYVPEVETLPVIRVMREKTVENTEALYSKKKEQSTTKWTAITEVDTKKKPGRRITRHYAALLRISNGVRPYFISIRS